MAVPLVVRGRYGRVFRYGLDKKNSSDMALFEQPVSPTTRCSTLRLSDNATLSEMRNSALNLGLGSEGGPLGGGRFGEGEGDVSGEGTCGLGLRLVVRDP